MSHTMCLHYNKRADLMKKWEKNPISFYHLALNDTCYAGVCASAHAICNLHTAILPSFNQVRNSNIRFEMWVCVIMIANLRKSWVLPLLDTPAKHVSLRVKWYKFLGFFSHLFIISARLL